VTGLQRTLDTCKHPILTRLQNALERLDPMKTRTGVEVVRPEVEGALAEQSGRKKPRVITEEK
jgi:hypothetical protein